MKPEFKRLIEMGCYLTPIAPGTKKEYKMKWGAAQYDLDEAKHQTRYVGLNDNAAVLVGPSNMVVIDVDDQGRWDAFRGDNELPETFTVKTTRDGGGYHYYYRPTESQMEHIPKTLICQDIGIDVKSSGVVVAPGSFIKDRGKAVIIEKDIEIVPFPEWLIGRLIKYGYTKNITKTNAVPLENPLAFKDFNWLVKHGLRTFIFDNTGSIMESRAMHSFGVGRDIGRYGWRIEDVPDNFLEELYNHMLSLKSDRFDFDTEFMFQLKRGIESGNEESFEIPEEENPFDAVSIEDGEDTFVEEHSVLLPMDCLNGIGKLIQPGADYSIDLLTKAFCGYTLGTTTVIFAPTGRGKTTFVHRELVHLLNQDVPVALIPTEETPEVAYMNVLKSATGLSLSNISTGDKVEDSKLMAKREIVFREFYTGKQLYIPKNVHKMSLPMVLEFIRDMTNKGVRHFFLDNITALAAKSRTDNRKAWEMIEEVISRIADLMRETQANMTVIGHTNEDKVSVTEYSIKGGQQIPNMVDNVIYLADAELKAIRDNNNLVIADFKVLELLKVRGDGSYKRARVGLQYNPITRQIVEAPKVLAFERGDRTDRSKDAKVNDPEFKIPIKEQVDSIFPEYDVKEALIDGLGFNDDQVMRWLDRDTPVCKWRDTKTPFKNTTQKPKHKKGEAI